MKVDPLCRQCTKACKQVRPAIVVSCAKFIQDHIDTKKEEKMTG